MYTGEPDLPDFTIDYYNHERDAERVLAAWQSAFGDRFRIDERALRAVALTTGPYRPGDHFVARRADQVIGFVFAQLVQQSDAPLHACLCAIGVARSFWRHGIGRALLSTACEAASQAGAVQIRLGGHLPRFFPSVPQVLPAAADFFVTQGFQVSAPDAAVYDLIQDLTDYRTSLSVAERIQKCGAVLRSAAPEDYADILAFHNREFPHWQPEYAHVIAVGDGADILIARDQQSGELLGTLIMFTPHSQQMRGDVLWWAELGEPLGALSAVGVSAMARGRGIGLALVGRGTELLKAHDVRVAHVGWTNIPRFYEQAGYRVWHAFDSGWRTLR
ncbi:MAG: GNAT family N-acetyltransferase [Anaerolineae bacterium]|nr:GNAT family N-acetyltransferase [Anaerolineae bacterium]